MAKDQVMPEGKWAFDGDVTDVFNDMLERSIPQYDVMRKTCFDIGRRFVQEGTAIVDLGCSRGEAIALLVDQFGAHNRFIGVDVSEPMLKAARERFEGLIRCKVVEIQNLDLRTSYPGALASLTMAVLTIQFTPIEHRLRIMRDVYQHTTQGGAFILVEKILGATADLDALMVRLYYEMKSNAGYSQDQIERKRLSLEGVLVPVTAKWNEEMLKMSGWTQVDCFWRWANFAAWIAVK